MKEFKGTKREWINTTAPSGKAKFVDSNGFPIANMSAGTTTDLANAKLIAAAPDLLEALIELVDALPSITPIHQDARVKACQAINKALGI